MINLAHTIPFFLYEKGKSKKINEFNNFLKLAIIKLVWFSENLWESREKKVWTFSLVWLFMGNKGKTNIYEESI